MIYKLDSIDRIIDKIIRDLGIGQDNIPYADFVEWIADALQHIGSYYQFTEKACTVIIDNFEGLLPCDLYKVIRMTRGTLVSPVEGGFYGGSLIQALNNAGLDLECVPAYDRFAIINQGLSRLTRTGEYKNNLSKLEMNKSLIGNPKLSSFTGGDYNINHDKINTAFRYGMIELQYLALPVDDRGWPMVPDDPSFRDATFWKVAYHISMRDPGCLKNPRMQDMEYCRQMWNKYCVQARAAANMPDLAAMERISNNWLSLINITNHQNNLYRDLGKQQRINLNGRF